MLNRNSIIAGVLMALLFPVAAFVAVYFLKGNIYLLNKPALPYLVAIALNLILMGFCAKKDLDKAVKGIMIATFITMVLLFLFKIHPIR